MLLIHWNTDNTDRVAMILISFLLATSVTRKVSGACPGHQGCPRCLDPGCTDCYTGYYGPNCSLSCSSGCRNNRCRLAPGGSAVCVEGCSPGLYGRQCNMACLSTGETCSKCPSHCEKGFCQLGNRCVSGCKDFYYGTGCFTCGPGCKVCNNVTRECYTCEQNCTFSDCFPNGKCIAAEFEQDLDNVVWFNWTILTVGVLFVIFLFLLQGVFVSFSLQRYIQKRRSRKQMQEDQVPGDGRVQTGSSAGLDSRSYMHLEVGSSSAYYIHGCEDSQI